MSFKDWIHTELINNGMFKSQADEVVKRIIEDEANIAMSERWNDEVEGYPIQMKVVLWMSAKRIGLQYIEETCPLAWFKPMFQ